MYRILCVYYNANISIYLLNLYGTTCRVITGLLLVVYAFTLCKVLHLKGHYGWFTKNKLNCRRESVFGFRDIFRLKKVLVMILNISSVMRKKKNKLLNTKLFTPNKLITYLMMSGLSIQDLSLTEKKS